MTAAAKPTKAPPRIVAVVGSDEAEIKRAAQSLAAELAPKDGGDFGSDVIDGAVDTVDKAADAIRKTIEALLTLPFFGGEKLVWLKNASFLADDVTGRSATVTDALAGLQELLEKGLPSDVRLLVSAIDVDKRRSFYKALTKLGRVDVFDRLDAGKAGWEAAASALVEERARARGLRFDDDAIEVFTQFTGGDTGQIENELEKLDLFLGAKRRAVAMADVDLLVPRTRAGVIWELGNAIARRNVPECLALIEQLFGQGENAVGILLVAVIPTVRNLLLVKDLMARHRLRPPAKPFFFGKDLERLPSEAIAHLPRKKDGGINAYPLGIAACGAHHFTVAELVDLYDACLRANIQLVTSSLAPRIVIEELVLRLAK